jgi:hypothetical protein
MMAGRQTLVLLMVLGSTLFAQTAPIAPATPSIVEEQSQQTAPPSLGRCETVSLTSKSEVLSPVILADKLRTREEFKNAGLSLREEPADVELAVSDQPTARIGGAPNLFTQTLFTMKSRPGSSPGVEIRALRRQDGMTAIGTVVALGNFEGFVAGRAIEVLRQLCPDVVTTSTSGWSGGQTADEPAMEQIRRARSLSVLSHTSWMDESMMTGVLAARVEIKARDLTVLAGEKATDLRLQVTRDIDNPVIWRYQLLDRQLQPLLNGSVGALNERHAREKIVNSITGVFSRDGSPKPSAVGNEPSRREVQPGTWRATLLAGDAEAAGARLEINIDGQRLVAHSRLGRKIFNIEAGNVEDVEYSSVRSHIVELPSEEGAVDFLQKFGEAESPASMAGGIAVLIAYAGVAVVLTPLHTRQHFVAVVWRDGDSFRQATFQVRGRDAEHLVKSVRGLIRTEALPIAVR